jgi:hypothetical protein
VTVEQEKPQQPAPPVICPEPIVVDDESDSDILEYVSDSEPKPVNTRPVLQSSHIRNRTADLEELDPQIRKVCLPFKLFVLLTSFFPFSQTYDARSKELKAAKAGPYPITTSAATVPVTV